MSEIKACPFCGFDTICEENHLVFCLNCGTSNHISEWNTRPIEDALQARIAELEAQQRWIPVSERLPECGGTYLVIYGDFFRDIGNYYFPDIWADSPLGADVKVTHWMPLPKLPEVKDE